MAKQKYIPLFDDQLEVISFLTDEQLGGAVRAAMQYMRSGEEPILEGLAGMFYQVLRAQYFRQQGFQQSGFDGGRPKKEIREEIEKEIEKEITPLFRDETPVSLIRDNITRDNIRKDSLSHSSAKPSRLSGEDFEIFWKAYPRKESKSQAKKSFAKVTVRLETLLNALETQKQSDQWKRNGGQYIPYASTWINQRRWEDEAPAQAAGSAEPVEDWQKEHPEWLDQSTWVCDVDGMYKPREACKGACV